MKEFVLVNIKQEIEKGTWLVEEAPSKKHSKKPTDNLKGNFIYFLSSKLSKPFNVLFY
jgi:hypothetical protein